MNPTQPSDTPRSDDAILVGSNTLNQGTYVHVSFSRQLELELSQWRACADALIGFSGHKITCPSLHYIPRDFSCNCGMKEARETFEKLKTSWPATGEIAGRLHSEAEKRLPFDPAK